MKGETSKIRFAEAQKLLDYGFSNYQYALCGSKGDVVKCVEVNKGLMPTVELTLENDCGALIGKGQNKNVTTDININNNISAPIKQGEKLMGVISRKKQMVPPIMGVLEKL